MHWGGVSPRSFLWGGRYLWAAVCRRQSSHATLLGLRIFASWGRCLTICIGLARAGSAGPPLFFDRTLRAPVCLLPTVSAARLSPFHLRALHPFRFRHLAPRARGASLFHARCALLSPSPLSSPLHAGARCALPPLCASASLPPALALCTRSAPCTCLACPLSLSLLLSLLPPAPCCSSLSPFLFASLSCFLLCSVPPLFRGPRSPLLALAPSRFALFLSPLPPSPLLPPTPPLFLSPSPLPFLLPFFSFPLPPFPPLLSFLLSSSLFLHPPTHLAFFSSLSFTVFSLSTFSLCSSSLLFASERSRPTPQRPVGLEVLREQYRQNQPIKRKLLSFARLYKRHGRRCLSQWHQLPPGVSWEAVEVALKGIVKNGLVEEEPAHTLKAGRATRGARKHS